MDRIDRSTIALFGIMMALSLLVNARAAETPTFNQVAPKAELKDSVNNPKTVMTQLVDFLLKNGDEFIFKEHIAPVIGLPGPMSSKVAKVAEGDHFRRQCYLVYEDSSDVAPQGGKRPVCVYLRMHSISGHDDEDRYFRVNLDGRLEKVVLSESKIDDDGHGVLGSGVASYPDIESSASKIAFAAEMAEMKKWLKAQRKHLTKANATKTDEKEAVAAPAASTSEPTPP